MLRQSGRRDHFCCLDAVGKSDICCAILAGAMEGGAGGIPSDGNGAEKEVQQRQVFNSASPISLVLSFWKGEPLLTNDAFIVILCLRKESAAVGISVKSVYWKQYDVKHVST